MRHKCHWDGCTKEVRPELWGCKEHWFTLPKFLRDRIWMAYVSGQEIRKDPSTEYLVVARLVQLWIAEYKAGRKLSEKEFCGPFIEKHRLQETLKSSAKGANELNESLRGQFGDETSNLRLRK